MKGSPRFILSAGCVAAAGLFFTMGQFEFLDVLGIKRPVQVLLLLFLAFAWAPFFLLGLRNALHEPLFLLLVAFLGIEVLVTKDTLTTIEMAVAASLSAITFSLKDEESEILLKSIVAISLSFAVLGILQFVILVLFPELTPYTISYRLQPEKGGDYHISHPIAYLGMTSGEVRSVLGLLVTRGQSFLREPSLITAYFFLPALLSLTLQGKWKLAAVPLVIFCMLSLTGSFYAVVLIFLVLFPFFRSARFRQRPRFLTWAPLLGSLLAIFLILQTNFFEELVTLLFRNPLIVSQIDLLEFLDRWSSAIGRLQTVKAYILEAPLGGVVSSKIPTAVGLILFSYLKASVLGAGLMVGFLFQVFRENARRLAEGRLGAITAALLAALFCQASFFSIYGLTTASGFLILALTLQRLRHLRERPASAGL